MKHFLLSAAAAMLFVGCSNAEDQSAVGEASAQASSQSTGAPVLRGNLESRFVQVAERSLQTQMLLYARLAPDGADPMQPISFDDEDREVFRCVAREYRNSGNGDVLEEAIEVNLRLSQYIETSPNLSFMTLENDEQFQTLTNEAFDAMDMELSEITAINSRCGMMALMSQKLDESGANAIMMQAMASEGG
ncbi:MAG: hypothetical protein AAFX09_08615 [Pseudomonadota bacterium]